MFTMGIQAKHKEILISVKVKHTMKAFEVVQSDVCSRFYTPTFGCNKHFVLFVADDTNFTLRGMLPDKKLECCTTAYTALQARVTTFGYLIRQFRCDNGQGEYDNNSIRLVLNPSSTKYEPRLSYTHHKNGVTEGIIHTINKKDQAVMIDSQAPVQCCGQAFNSPVYLHQRSPNEGLTQPDDQDCCRSPFECPYEMLRAFGKPTGNGISNNAPINHQQ
jgi:hypothetical protein